MISRLGSDSARRRVERERRVFCAVLGSGGTALKSELWRVWGPVGAVGPGESMTIQMHWGKLMTNVGAALFKEERRMLIVDNDELFRQAIAERGRDMEVANCP